MKLKCAEDQIKGSYCLGAVLIDNGAEGLLLHLKKDGVEFNVWLEPYGDCCSHSYIESINDIDDLKDCVIFDYYEESNDKEDDEDEYGNTVRYHFYKFKTSNGYVDVEMRNESNGYYDGNLEAKYRNFDVRPYYTPDQLVIEYPATQALYATNAPNIYFGPEDEKWKYLDISSWHFSPRNHHQKDDIGQKGVIGFMKTSRYKDGATYPLAHTLAPVNLPTSFYEDK
jgi:hypothetical protein